MTDEALRRCDNFPISAVHAAPTAKISRGATVNALREDKIIERGFRLGLAVFRLCIAEFGGSIVHGSGVGERRETHFLRIMGFKKRKSPIAHPS